MFPTLFFAVLVSATLAVAPVDCQDDSAAYDYLTRDQVTFVRWKNCWDKGWSEEWSLLSISRPQTCFHGASKTEIEVVWERIQGKEQLKRVETYEAGFGLLSVREEKAGQESIPDWARVFYRHNGSPVCRIESFSASNGEDRFRLTLYADDVARQAVYESPVKFEFLESGRICSASSDTRLIEGVPVPEIQKLIGSGYDARCNELMLMPHHGRERSISKP